MEIEQERIKYPHIRHIYMHLSELDHRAGHIHGDTEVLAVLRGSAEIQAGSSRFRLERGRFAIFNTRETHRIDSGEEPPLLLLLQYSPYLFREYYPHARRMIFRRPDVCASLPPEQVEELMRELCRMLKDYYAEDRLFELRCLSRLTGLLARFGELPDCDFLQPDEHHDRLRQIRKLDRVLDYMEEKYQTPLRVEELAEVAGLAPSYFPHFFRSQMGVSFQEHLSTLRFENALRVISRPASLRDIALGSGFSDTKYLNRMFERKLGCTATEYRARLPETEAAARRHRQERPGEIILSAAEKIGRAHV